MQVYEKNPIDARTFPEIWASLTASEKEELTYQLFRTKCTKTRQTIWNWSTGKKKPNMPLVRDTVASVVSKVIGVKCLGTTLFPIS